MRVATKRRYDRAFVEDTLALMKRGGRSVPAISADLGVPLSTLYGWYNCDMAKRGKGKGAAGTAESTAATETDAEKISRLESEVAALRKKNAELEVDRAILKKAAAFFAKESE
jgi:transposase